MNIFINDIPVCILSEKKAKDRKTYNLVVNTHERIVLEVLEGTILMLNVSHDQIVHLLRCMTDSPLDKVESIYIASKKKKALIHYIREQFKVIRAAGGIVHKEGKILLIYRKKKWDLPKGKRDKKERIKACAVREVQEETGVKVKIERKIKTIWHTYILGGKYVLKKTHWYAMRCLSDKKMAPQIEEGIKKVKWMSGKQVGVAMHDSYRSIRYIIEQYAKKS